MEYLKIITMKTLKQHLNAANKGFCDFSGGSGGRAKMVRVEHKCSAIASSTTSIAPATPPTE